jgi:hypothetical protein
MRNWLTTSSNLWLKREGFLLCILSEVHTGQLQQCLTASPFPMSDEESWGCFGPSSGDRGNGWTGQGSTVCRTSQQCPIELLASLLQDWGHSVTCLVFTECQEPVQVLGIPQWLKSLSRGAHTVLGGALFVTATKGWIEMYYHCHRENQ